MTAQIYKALVKNYEEVESRINRNATAREIGKFLAERAMRQDGRTHAEHFDKFPPKWEGDSVRCRGGDLVSILTQEGRKLAARLAARHSAKGKFLRQVEKICGYVEIPFPGRGRPRRKS